MSSMSPRLPSPPPTAEIQIGPNSPGPGATANEEAQLMEQTVRNDAKRRIRPGTRSADMAAGPPLVPLNELDSAFQLQEHLAALHYHHTKHNTQPLTRETAAILAAVPDPSIDKNLWLYELCRFIISQCNSLIVGFLFDTPPCSQNTCPEMRASEWQFLCAVHDQPKSCCAIDYCCHTLDWAANVVTNPKLFPSRFVAPGSDGSGHDRNTAVKNLINVFRRLHRIFAHAWFQHRGVFWNVEGQTGMYLFFKTVCDTFDTLPAENYKLPPEAEGLESAVSESESSERGAKRNPLMPAPTILQRSEDDSHLLPSRTNTRRHIRGSPSTGSSVTTVLEAEEDEDLDVSSSFGEMRISAPETFDEEPEVAEVPVIVEQGMMEEARAASGRPETVAAQPEDRRDDKPIVSEQEVKPDDEPEDEAEASNQALEDEEAPQVEEVESTMGTQADGQDEALELEDENESAEGEFQSSATEETAPAPFTIRDLADQAQHEPPDMATKAAPPPDESENSEYDKPVEERPVY